MSCSSGCLTQDHASWGECVRSKGVQIDRLALNQVAGDAQRRSDKELNLYEAVRRDGIQPETTKTRDILHAIKTNKVA